LVSPRRIPGLYLDADRFPGNATVITSEDIKRMGATTTQGAISRAEGVTWLDTGGFGTGSDASLSLRGMANNSRTEALVFVDGVRQNHVTGDQVHWQSIPVQQIERIEIIRGGSGTIYGEGALSGVINIVTKQDSERPLETEEGLEFGSFGWQQYSFGARGHSGPFGYGTTYTRRLFDGYRDYSSSRNTTITTHNAFTPFAGANFSVDVLHHEDTTYTPGGLTQAQVEADRRQAVQSRVTLFDDSSDQVALRLAVGPYDGLTWMVDSFWKQMIQDSRRSNLFEIAPSRGLNVRSCYEWKGLEATSALISGLELVEDKASTGTRGDPRVDESNKFGYGLYLEETLTFWDRLTLVGGFRYDRLRFAEDIIAYDSLGNPVNFVGTLNFEGKAPKVGVTYTVIPGTAWVFTNYSRPFKSPNVDDFSSRTPDFRGNVSLRPQQADAYELGGRWRHGPFETKATWFLTTTKDEILFVQGIPGNTAIFQNQNHDTRRVGLEWGAHVTLPHLRGFLNYTFVDARFRKGAFAGNFIPGTPEDTVNAGIGVSPFTSFWMDLEWQIVDRYYRINDVTNTFPRQGFGALNLSFQYDLPVPKNHVGWSSAHAYLKLQNLTNEEYVAFASSNGHTLATGAGDNPMPPFNVLWGINLTF